MNTKHTMTKITIAKGDGIGPEIMDATLAVLKAAGANLEFEEIQVGEKVYLSGNTSGIPKEAWDAIKTNKIFLKAPITTPQGGGYKSLNVTMRKTLGLFANVRPCVSYHPFVNTKHPVMDMVIIRENEEDLYAGIEHQQTEDVVQCLKLTSVSGSERIIRYAFEFARAHNRKKVTCFSKDNIMKQTDGLFRRIFNEVAKEYPDLENEHWIIDIGSAKIANKPEQFDVVVMQNLYGDIVSDIAAEISGSVGLGGSSNIGESVAMFEAIHGSAPDIAGKNIANPSGLLNAAVMMLYHVGEPKTAAMIHNAWLKTLEEGLHTADIYSENLSKKRLGTKEFAEAVIANLGKLPNKLKAKDESQLSSVEVPIVRFKASKKKELLGVDVFVDAQVKPNEIGEKLIQASGNTQLKLEMITNRGVKVFPDGFEETFCTNHWRCRFKEANGKIITMSEVIELLNALHTANIDIIKTENLYQFDGVKAFSLGQGQ